MTLSFFRCYTGRSYQISSAWQGDHLELDAPAACAPLLDRFCRAPVSRWLLCDRRAVIWSASSNPISICCLLPENSPGWGQWDDAREGKPSGNFWKYRKTIVQILIMTSHIVIASERRPQEKESRTCRGQTTAINSITSLTLSNLLPCYRLLLAPRTGARASKPVELAEVCAPTFA